MTLVEKVLEAGIIGAGGAGFPTHVKLSSQAEYLLLNGAECEPLLRVDQQLMAVYPEEIIRGFELARKEVGAEKAIIGIKNKHKKVIEILQENIDRLGLKNVEIKPMADVYPAGDEQVLVKELTGRIVPELGIPINVGCIVINSETALNIYYAKEGKSVTHTFLTVTGEVPNPITLKVPVGTPIECVLKEAGVENIESMGIIDGGPMMGPILEDTSSYVTKKSKGFIVLPKEHKLIAKKSATDVQTRRVNRATCEQCRMCTDLCPRFLLGHDIQPHRSMRVLNYGIYDKVSMETAGLCCQCNLCEYFSCPADLFPRRANVLLKEKGISEGLKHTVTKENFEERKMRPYRQLPSKRLVARLALKKYDRAAPLVDKEVCSDYVRILTSQHVGAPAKPIVSINDQVIEGQLIGTLEEGKLGANIHASISGRVTEITPQWIEIRR